MGLGAVAGVVEFEDYSSISRRLVERGGISRPVTGFRVEDVDVSPLL